MASDASAVCAPAGNLSLAGGMLGFALGGFFDGILLHQVLQWHHLLSLVPGEALRDIRVQVLADGLFHVLMYAIAASGLWLLWRSRGGFTGSASDHRLLGAVVLGFSLWQFVDVVFFHWILGIHRTRVDVPDPLFWDLAWTAVFGLPTLILGFYLRRGGGQGEPPKNGTRRRTTVPAALAALVLIAGPVAAVPPPGRRTALVLFGPSTSPAQAFAAVSASDGRILWADSSGTLLAVEMGEGGGAGRLYRQGALFVNTSAALAGCLAWSRLVKT